MATLKQTGVSPEGGALPTAQEIHSGTTVRPTQKVAGESLANDLAKALGEGGKAVQTGYELSTEAAKRVALDSLTNLSRDIDLIKSVETPDTDLEEQNKQIEAVYLSYSNRIFDNEDAQRVYDSMYGNSAKKSVASIMSANSEEQSKKNAIKLMENSLAGVEEMYKAGVMIDEETLNTLTNVVTAGGYYNREEAQYFLADRATTAFDSKVTNDPSQVLHDAGYIREIGFTNEVAKRIFDANYGAYGTLDEETGEFKWNEGIDNKAQEEIMNSWRRFENVMNSLDSDSVGDPFKELRMSTNTMTSEAADSYFRPNEIQSNIASVKKRKEEIISLGIPYTDEQLRNLEIAEKKLQNELAISEIVTRDLANPSGNNFKKFVQDGKIVTKFYDNVAGIYKKQEISPKRYQAAIQRVVEENSRYALSLDTTKPQEQKKFQAAVQRVKQLEQYTGKDYKSALTKKYGDIDKGGSYSTMASKKDVRQLIEYNKVTLQNDKNNAVLKNLNTELESIAYNYRDKGEENQQLMAVNSTISSYRSNEGYAIQSRKNRQMLDDIISKKAKGKGLFALEGRTNETTNASILKKQYATGKGDLGAVWLEEEANKLARVGSILPYYGDSRQYVMFPEANDASEKVVREAIDSTLDYYNKNNEEDLDTSDIVITNDYKNGDYTLILKSVKTGYRIGEITNSDLDLAASKIEEKTYKKRAKHGVGRRTSGNRTTRIINRRR